MRILVVDDAPLRRKAYEEQLAEHQLTLAATVDAAREALRSNTAFDVLYLDYDMNDFAESVVYSMYGKQELTGRDVSLFIIQNLPVEKWPKEVVINSWNHDGAQLMLLDFQNAGIPACWCPFQSTKPEEQAFQRS